MDTIILKIFWSAMIATALFVIIGIWFENMLPESFFKIAGTLFVIGLANFLLWVPLMAYRFLQR